MGWWVFWLRGGMCGVLTGCVCVAETNLATWKLPEVEAMLRSENMKEGTTAFVGKRKPRWGPYAKL